MTQMPIQEPFLENRQFPTQEGAIIDGQPIGRTTGLDRRQGRQGVAVEALAVSVVQRVQVGPLAQVAEQQETAVEVLGQNLRGIQANGPQLPGNSHEATAILLLRGGVHDDEGPPSLP